MSRYISMRRGARREANFLGAGGDRAYRIKKIHPPPDPSLSILDSEQRDFWEMVRNSAYDYYSTHGAPDAKNVAKRSAWKATLGRHGLQNVWTNRDGRAKAEVTSLPTPRPAQYSGQKTVEIGPILEYTWIDQETGELVVCSWKREAPPRLHWNIQSKSLLVFPHVPDKLACKPIPSDMQEEARMYKVFTQREPKCMTEFRIPSGKIYPIGMADAVVYVSDKWHSRNPDMYMSGSQEYFHQHSDGTWAYQDVEDNPAIVRMHGGMLDVESRGIIH